jgi:hypothetical protein
MIANYGTSLPRSGSSNTAKSTLPNGPSRLSVQPLKEVNLSGLTAGHVDYGLITSSYKKSRMAAPFVPVIERAQRKPVDRKAVQLYCGYEDFSLPKSVKSMVSKAGHASQGA